MSDCSKGCTGRVHETTILGTAPKLHIINMSGNTTSTNFCQTPVEIPSSLYLDGFIGDSYGSINYTLISLVYCYGNNLTRRHFNVRYLRKTTLVLFLIMVLETQFGIRIVWFKEKKPYRYCSLWVRKEFKFTILPWRWKLTLVIQQRKFESGGKHLLRQSTATA